MKPCAFGFDSSRSVTLRVPGGEEWSLSLYGIVRPGDDERAAEWAETLQELVDTLVQKDRRGDISACVEKALVTGRDSPFHGLEKVRRGLHLLQEAPRVPSVEEAAEHLRRLGVLPGACTSAESATRQRQPAGYVYYIEAVGLNAVKIGWSGTPKNRVSQLQTGCPVELRLLGQEPGQPLDEENIRGLFPRIRGEWVEFVEELKLRIAGLPSEAA